MNSWVDGSHGYKGRDPSSNNGLDYYVFTVYAIDKTLGMYPANTGNGNFLWSTKSVRVLGYGNIIGTYQRFNRG